MSINAVVNTISRFSFLFDFERLISGNDLKLFAPYYHTISDKPLQHIKPLYDYHSLKEFSNQLDLMKKHFEFVSAKDIPEILSSKSVKKKKYAFLSFDDGLLECYENIFPILEEKGIPATFFINPDFIDTEDIFYRYKVALLISSIQNNHIDEGKLVQISSQLNSNKQTNEPILDALISLSYKDIHLINELMSLANVKYRNRDIYMSSKMIKELKNAGHSIGGHSMNHPLFEELHLDEQLDQIRRSIDFCQMEFKESMKLFAFPFYDYNLGTSLFQKMYDELKVDVSFGTSGLKRDLYSKNIQRLAMEEGFDEIESFLKSQFVYYKLKKIVSKHIIRRS